MSLTNTLIELKPSGAFPQRLLLKDAGVAATIEMEVHSQDALSLQISMLKVFPEAVIKTPLRDRANAIAQRATGLMEKLSVIEVDDAQGKALLRSNEPVTRDVHRLYYELLLEQKGSATLHRYEGSMTHSNRQEKAFTLTREALAKLITDLSQR